MPETTQMALPIGVEKLAVAMLTSDTAGGLVYGTPEYYPDVQKLSMKPKTNSSTLYTEGRLKLNQIDLDSIDVGITIAQLISAHKAALLGQTIASAGGVYMTQEDHAPYVAILYKAPIVGGYRYGVIYKGRFGPYDEEYAQKEGKTTFGAPVLAATFLPTDYVTAAGKHLVEYHVDTIDPNCPADIDTKWFQSVVVPEADTTIPTVTVSPADAATGVLPSANVIWTFSEAIDPAKVTSGNFMLFDASTGTLVPGALSLDSTPKIVALDPTANLTAGTAYIAVATKNITDFAGNALAANSITNFTTAS